MRHSFINHGIRVHEEEEASFPGGFPWCCEDLQPPSIRAVLNGTSHPIPCSPTGDPWKALDQANPSDTRHPRRETRHRYGSLDQVPTIPPTISPNDGFDSFELAMVFSVIRALRPGLGIIRAKDHYVKAAATEASSGWPSALISAPSGNSPCSR